MSRQAGILSVIVGVLVSSSAGLGAPPVLEVSPLYMEFFAEEGGSNPASQALSIWKGGGNGPLMWEVTEDCNWLSVAPTSGTSMGEVDIVGVFVDITGVPAGSYSCQLTVTGDRADNSPQIVDVNLVVAGPEIGLSATQFYFTGYWGGSNPADQILGISNSGIGTLDWEISEDCNWLSGEPNSGSSTGEVDDVNLSVDITGLVRGTYDCNLVVSATNAINSPQVVGVSLSIIAEGLWVEPASFDVNVLEGTSLPDSMTIWNDGDGAVEFMIRSRPVGESEGAAGGRGVSSSVRAHHDFSVAADVPYNEERLIVRFSAGAGGQVRSMSERSQILSSVGGGTIERDFEIVPGLSVVKLPEGVTVEDALGVFNNSDGVLYAEPDYEVEVDATFPNDARFDDLWGMHNTGQTGGADDADIDAPEAWDIATGSDGVVVAVIDTGVDYTHADLAANMWENEAEKNGTPGVDDDGNGYIDDIYGYDFRNNDGNPMDDHYHGTHCAGTIGGVGNNAEGVAGVCWDVRIMAVKFLSSGGSGSTSDAILSVQYATLMGANVTSNSWGGGGYSQGLKDAIDAAGAAGILFVAAAGNNSSNTDSNPHYPSSYDCESLIAVMATNHNDDKSGFSNWGPTTVDLGAPGSNILSCKLGGGYKYASGTSMATPHVAGACALLWSMDPFLSNSEVKDILLSTVDATLAGLCVSEGRLNIYKAILETEAPWIEIEPEAGTIGPGDSNVISLTFNAFERGMEMEVGTYEAEIVIIANDPCIPVVVVPVTMTVTADDLAVTPRAVFDSNGLEGGPFEPNCMSYTLTNNGAVAVNWGTSAVQSWLSVEPNAGVLDANGSIDVNVCISAEANLVDPNIYSEILIFENLNSGSIKPRAATLTVRPPDCFTESFGADLDFLSLTFSPDGSNAYYEACRDRVAEFATEPSGGTAIVLGDDDFAEVVLGGGEEVLFYGQWYDRLYVGSNGYITFGQGDVNASASLENHFSLPRISALFADLDPSGGGSVSYKQLEDRVAVTFEDAPLSGDVNATNSFQIEMFFVDGSMCVSWLELAASSGVAGLSKGRGLPPMFFSESDLTGYLPCRPWGDFSRDYSVNFGDFEVLAGRWLAEACGIPSWCEKTDLDFSGMTDGVDLKIFTENWLASDPWWLEPVSHWTFDEGTGDTAYDWSRTNHGTIYGASWTTGKFGGALSFDGVEDYVDVGTELVLAEVSVCAWVKTINGAGQLVFSKKGSSSGGHEAYSLVTGDLYHGSVGTVLTRIKQPGSVNFIDLKTTERIDDGLWHFIAMSYDGTVARLYIDGESKATSAPGGAINYASETEKASIGATISTSGFPVGLFDGAIDDVRVYDRALGDGEIWLLYIGGLGGKAYDPHPADGAASVDPNVILSWRPGLYAASHDVYFGTDEADVNEATTSSAEYRGNQEANSWDVNNYDANGLALATTYYWRIDRVNGLDAWKGDVWSFRTWTKGFDPNLVSWWKFDEGTGSTAYDSAGGNDGTISGATWTSGQIGGALNFDGVEDYVDVGTELVLAEVSVCAWVKTINGAGQLVFSKKGSSSGGHEAYSLVTGDLYHGSVGTVLTRIKQAGSVNFIDLKTTERIDDGQWHFIAMSYDGTVAALYIDGESKATSALGGAINYASETEKASIGASIGTSGLPVGFFDGVIDDVRVYDWALGAGEVWQLYVEGLSRKAYEPHPADRATGVEANVVLGWRPGLYAASHDVYFGTDEADVNEATTSSAEYRGNQEANSWDPCGVDSNSSYYWRIDEVNGADTNSPWKGDVWSFTTWAEFDPNLGLVSWWKFDEGSGTTAYDSAGDNDGNVYGAVWTSGQIGGALSFDGVEDYVDVGTDLVLAEVSVCAWVKTINDAGQLVFSKKGKSYGGHEAYSLVTGDLYHGSVGTVLTRIKQAGSVNFIDLKTTERIDNGQWHFIAMSYDGTVATLYIDGESKATSAPGGAINYASETEKASVGASISTSGLPVGFFDGVIDDVRVYDRALGAGEIWQLYQGGL